ncbi:MAG: ABC transporter permease [Clostridia bacterium]|nr:ABC transporter permease [Clostridia bacterium]
MKLFYSDLKKFFPLLLNLSAKDIKIKYRRSVLGILWSIFNPLLTMLVLTQVFSMLLKVQVENFATYYILGSSLWNFFSEATTLSMMSIISSSALIKKVYVPKYIFPLEKCLFALINFAFSMVAVVVVMLFQGTKLTATLLLFPIPVLYCFVFCIGFSLILSALTVYFRDIMHLYGILLTIWIYLTPIIYPEELIKHNSVIYSIVKCNPMYYFVKYFRDVMMYNALPTFSENLICIFISLFTLLLGAIIFNKAEKKFILHI